METIDSTQSNQKYPDELTATTSLNALIALSVESNSLLSQLCILQESTSLAVSALAEMSYTLITGMSLQGVGQGGTQAGTLSGSVAAWMGITAFSAQAADMLSAGQLSTAAIGWAEKNTVPFLKSAGKGIATFGSQALTAAEALAAIPAVVALGVFALCELMLLAGFAGLGYAMEKGWIEKNNMDQMTETLNTVGDIYAASNPFIYEGDDTPKLSDYTPTERGELFRQNYEKRKKAQHNVEHMTSIIDQAGGVMPTSGTDIFPTHSAFANRQTNQPQPTATFDGWQQQQTQLADIQAQTAQFWQTYSESTQNQPITLNVTNNFKGVTQDRKSLIEISDYMARQIRDDLNAGRPLYSHN